MVRESGSATVETADGRKDAGLGGRAAYLSMAARTGPEGAESAGAGMSYLMLQRAVLAHGLGALPAGVPGGGADGGAALGVEGLEALPAWQRRGAGVQGGHS